MNDDRRDLPGYPVRAAIDPEADAAAEPTTGGVPAAEREFFIEEFRGITIVVALPVLTDAGLDAVRRTIDAFSEGDTRFVLVVPEHRLPAASAAVDGRPVHSTAVWTDGSVAELWLAVADSPRVVVGVEDSAVARTAGAVCAYIRASKMVLTDPAGGWGTPPRSYADIDAHHDPLASHLAGRGLADYVPAALEALAGGAYSVNLCRAEDLEFELLTFNGRGTVLTQGRYLHVEPLRVDDLPAVEALVARGVASGLLKPRSRFQVANMAAGGIGARVLRTGHLAGIVGLEVDRYAGTGFGEVSGLITVAEFSGLGAGGLLIDGLVEVCRSRGVTHLFAVTVSGGAADFFARRGFDEVAQSDVPAAKWDGYEEERRRLARCFVRAVPSPIRS